MLLRFKIKPVFVFLFFPFLSPCCRMSNGQPFWETVGSQPRWPDDVWLTLSSPALSLPRERRRVWRCVLEGSHPGPILCQREGPDLLRPARDQTGRAAESAGILHGLFPLFLQEPHSHLQLEEEGKLAVSASFPPSAVSVHLG